ncbi:hypothetical protein QCA50_002209 [Cerrena zonata]|uniref:Thioredoxin domain-containing protein n=1 Tax=Cerrena zonata TaxID=2478898 RepID=A0AAW0GQV2_9APHY
MPIHTTEDPAKLESVKGASEKFLIFFSSRNEGGKLWCPDCVAVEELIERTFAPADAPDALLVYVGQKPEWKSPANVFRGPPFNVGSIPTIIRVHDGARLVDGDFHESLATFLS